MKTKLFSLMAVGAMALGLTTACSDDNAFDASTGGEATVSFTVGLPTGVGSRADAKPFGDGTLATELQYYVYEQSKTNAIISGTATFSSLKTTVELKLVTGKTYDILFWADHFGKEGANSPFSYSETGKTITVDYSTITSNSDNYDAFYVKETVEVKGPISKDVVLTRPFAQVNFGTDDLDAPALANIKENLTAQVVAKQVQNVLNLDDGKVSGTATDITFAAQAFPSSTEWAFPYSATGKTYSYVAMDYILVGADKATMDLDLKILESNAEVNTVKVPNAPVQRNYRTNIYGSLLTSTVNFNVEIQPAFTDPAFDYEVKFAAGLSEANTLFSEGNTNVVVTSYDANETDWTVNLPSTTDEVTLSLPAVPSDQTITINYATSATEGSTVSKPTEFYLSATDLDATSTGGTSTTGTGNVKIELVESTVYVNGVNLSTLEAKTSANTLVIGEDATIGTVNLTAGAIKIYGSVGTLTNSSNLPVRLWAVGTTDEWAKAYAAGADTIELKNDIDFSSVVLVDRNLKINGKGYAINNTDKRVLRMTTASAAYGLEAYDTKFISKCTNTSDVRGISIDNDVPNNCSLTLDNCEITASFYAINIVPGGQNLSITASNSTITGWAVLNAYPNNSTISFDKCTLKGINDKAENDWNDYATIVLDGNGINNYTPSTYGSNNTINITNSTIISETKSANRQDWISVQFGAQSNTINVDAATRIIDGNGNDHTSMISEAYVYYSGDNQTTYVPTYTINVGGEEIYPAKAVAEAAGIKFANLQNAWDYLSFTEDKTVKLLRDVNSIDGYLYAQGDTATFDLGGHTLKVTNDTKYNHRALRIDSGKLTVKNGTIDARNVNAAGQPEAMNDKSRYTEGIYGTIRIESKAEAILDGLTLYNNHCWGMSVKSASNVEIKNCTLYSEVGGGVDVAGGKVNISDCIFQQTGVSSYGDYVSSAIAVSYGGTANVTDTEVSAEALTPIWVFSSGGTINIAGGTYVGRSTDKEPKVLQADVDLNTYPSAVATINISGGTFTGTMNKTDSEKAVISITGGTFSVDPTKYVADGHSATQQGDAWVVQ